MLNSFLFNVGQFLPLFFYFFFFIYIRGFTYFEVCACKACILDVICSNLLSYIHESWWCKRRWLDYSRLQFDSQSVYFLKRTILSSIKLCRKFLHTTTKMLTPKRKKINKKFIIFFCSLSYVSIYILVVICRNFLHNIV